MNTQTAEKVTNYEDSYDVVNTWATLQGEGPAAGTPAVFVRMAGCTLQCPQCDTLYTTPRTITTAKELMQSIANCMGETRKIVVLTGGEPFRQNIGPLCKYLIDSNLSVHIETNGGLWRDNLPIGEDLTIVCSPKLPFVHGGLQPHVSALKYVVEHGCVSAEDGLPNTVLGLNHRPARPWIGYKGPIYIQPMDSQNPSPIMRTKENRKNMDAAVESCMEFGYILSLQLHKVLGLE